MLAKEGHEPQLAHQHQLLQANCLAQSQALMLGRDLPAALKIAKSKGFEGAELQRQASHRVFKGNRPSTTLIYPKLTPFCLGQLIALYEHRVFVEGVILAINGGLSWARNWPRLWNLCSKATVLGATMIPRHYTLWRSCALKASPPGSDAPKAERLAPCARPKSHR
jgi:hypothetical protein